MIEKSSPEVTISESQRPASTHEPRLIEDSCQAVVDTAAGQLSLLSRREFLADTTAIGVILAVRDAKNAEEVPANSPTDVNGGATELSITLQINGKPVTMSVDPRVTLLDAIRNHAGLYGAKMGCDHGQCGACTVHIDGRRVCSCLTLAVMHQDQEIITIEGLEVGDALHPMQAAFLRHDGFQCGFCTPGQVMSAVSVVAEGHAHSDAEIKESMSGNICRCAAYPNIVAAIKQVMGGKENASV